MAPPFGAGALALTLAGSGALFALQLKVVDQCTNPSELAKIGVMNNFTATAWWLALASSIAFSFAPDDERVADGEETTRSKAAFATLFCSSVVSLCSIGGTLEEAFKCDMLDWSDVHAFAWVCLWITAVVAALSLAWRARKDWEQRAPKESPAADSYEKLESA